jgi:hypothetical protein
MEILGVEDAVILHVVPINVMGFDQEGLATEVLNILLNVLELQVCLISARERRRGECQAIPEVAAGETEKTDLLFQRIPRDGDDPARCH